MIKTRQKLIHLWYSNVQQNLKVKILMVSFIKMTTMVALFIHLDKLTIQCFSMLATWRCVELQLKRLTHLQEDKVEKHYCTTLQYEQVKPLYSTNGLKNWLALNLNIGTDLLCRYAAVKSAVICSCQMKCFMSWRLHNSSCWGISQHSNGCL